MELTVLGSGTLIFQEDRSCSSYLLRHEKGLALLDCGPGCLMRMHRAGVGVTELSLILISHFHWDHVAELPALLNSIWLQRKKARGVLQLAGPPGLSAWVDRVMAEDRDWLAELKPRVSELGEEPEELAGLRVRAGRNYHTENSLSYRLENREGVALFYSGDMDYQEALLPLAARADLAVVECSWPERRRGSGHLDPRGASRFAAAAEVRALLLTHFYQEMDWNRLAARVQKEYSGPVLLAEDLRIYAIPWRKSSPA
jgi:ribonuclease BN (tRNA processing enzyme)